MPLLADGLHNVLHASQSCAFRIHKLPPFFSISSLHLLCGLPSDLFPFLGVHPVALSAHLVFCIRVRCPAHFPLLLSILSMMSLTLAVIALILSFLILSFNEMFGIDLSMLHWAACQLALLLFRESPWFCVVGHRWYYDDIHGFLLKHMSIFLSFRKSLNSLNLFHPAVILWSISLFLTKSQRKRVNHSNKSVFWNCQTRWSHLD